MPSPTPPTASACGRGWPTSTRSRRGPPSGRNEGAAWDHRRAQLGLDRAVALVKRLRERGNPRLTGFLFPYQAGNCSADLLRETMRQSRLLGDVHVRTHVAEYASDVTASMQRHGKPPLEWLLDTGLVGPQVCLTHAIHYRDFAEVEALARSGTSVCHCPV